MGALPLTVVIPAYNRADVLPRALNSVLSGMGPGDEVVVVDDGSTDDTARVLAGYGAPVRVIVTSNGGPGAARNRGVAEARTPLVAFLDSDDELMKGSLDLRRTCMAARPDVVYCFSNFAATLPDGRRIHDYLPRWHCDTRTWDEILGPGVTLESVAAVAPEFAQCRMYVGDMFANEARANYVFTSTLMVRRELAGVALRFGTDLPMYEDWTCFGTLSRRGPAAYLDVETAWQHASPGERVSGSDAAVRAAARLALLERLWGADEAYMATHHVEYASVVAHERLQLVRALIGQGRSAEARRVLRDMASAPLHYRLLAAAPGPLLRRLSDTRRWLQRLSGAERRAAARWEAPESEDALSSVRRG